MTVSDISALYFQYLSGVDLLDFFPSNFLLNQEVNNVGFLARQVNKAYGEIISQLSSKCQIATELQKKFPTGTDADTRSQIIVKYVTLMAIENIVSKSPGLPVALQNHFVTTHQSILAIRNGQMGIPDLQIESETSTNDNKNISKTTLVESNFQTRG